MNTPHFLKVKETGVALVIAALCVGGLYSTVRLAMESRENAALREQTKVLNARLMSLDTTFERIRSYTRSVHALATADAQVIISDEVKGGLVTLASVENPMVNVEQENDASSFAGMLDLLGSMKNDADSLSRRLENLAAVLKTRKELLNDIPSMMPVEGRIASEYGVRLSPFEGKRHMHAGIDIAAEVGEKIRAPADGEVTFAGNFESLGNSIVLNHGNGILTRYGHTSKLLVRNGQKVRRGQVIALVGNTGRSTGPHLHYEVWVNNEAANPRDFFFDITAKPSMLVKNDLKALPANSAAALAAMGGDL